MFWKPLQYSSDGTGNAVSAALLFSENMDQNPAVAAMLIDE